MSGKAARRSRARSTASRPTRARRRWLWLALGAVALAAAVGALLWAGRSGAKQAIIIDQLSLRHPNPAFVSTVTGILETAGYQVTYVPGEQVTVDLYRDLPAGGYDFILLRSHSARRAEQEGGLADDVTLFTVERFNWDRYVDAIRAKRVGAVYNEYEDTIAGAPPADPSAMGDDGEGVTFGGRKLYFGVRGAFIDQDTVGRFDRGPTVVLMGCDGLRSDRMAEAFVDKGAGAFISWDQPVSIDRTDRATELLVRHLTDKLPVAEAVERTMATIGPDPEYGSALGYYPR